MVRWHIARLVSVASIVAAAACSGLGADEVGSVGQEAKGKGSPPAAPTLEQQLLARGAGEVRCAVENPSDAEVAAVEAELGNVILDSKGVFNIAVHWHVVTTSTGGGDVSALIPAQMAVLNAAFASSGFTFTVASQEVVANDAWFFGAQVSPEELAMKRALRRGGPRDLNIYTTNGDIFLGWATFPHQFNFFPFYDGVVLWWAALPGTGLAATGVEEEPDGVLTYDQGDTGTHEVGHWVGLYHTFQGSCSKQGDVIKDTPAEFNPQFFCAERDSCTGNRFPGTDPIHNFMDYVDDPCMDHFTAEQTKRMRVQFHAFRDKAQ